MEAAEINAEAEKRAQELTKQLVRCHPNHAIELIAWCKVIGLMAVIGDVSWPVLLDVVTTAYEGAELTHKARKS